MSRSIDDIIAQAKVPKSDERLKDIVGSYRFDIEGVGSFILAVDHGRFVARDAARDEPADCIIGASADDFARIIEGEQNLLTAFMQGRVTMEGDLALAKAFHGFLPGPGRARERVPTQEGARP